MTRLLIFGAPERMNLGIGNVALIFDNYIDDQLNNVEGGMPILAPPPFRTHCLGAAALIAIENPNTHSANLKLVTFAFRDIHPIPSRKFMPLVDN